MSMANFIASLQEEPETRKKPAVPFYQYIFKAYGRDLLEAQDWCRKYALSNNVKDLNQAWDLYYHVFRRITKQLPQVSCYFTQYFKNVCFIIIIVLSKLTSLEMQYVSPKLMVCHDLELAVPGTYTPKQPVIRIQSVNSTLQVITSKQRPRKLRIQGMLNDGWFRAVHSILVLIIIFLGSNGKEYAFLLKGHEDLRQDERVMQLFGLVNTLLSNDQNSSRKNLRYGNTEPVNFASPYLGWLLSL